jgi:hypothetical protein
MTGEKGAKETPKDGAMISDFQVNELVDNDRFAERSALHKKVRAKADRT